MQPRAYRGQPVVQVNNILRSFKRLKANAAEGGKPYKEDSVEFKDTIDGLNIVVRKRIGSGGAERFLLCFGRGLARCSYAAGSPTTAASFVWHPRRTPDRLDAGLGPAADFCAGGSSVGAQRVLAYLDVLGKDPSASRCEGRRPPVSLKYFSRAIE